MLQTNDSAEITTPINLLLGDKLRLLPLFSKAMETLAFGHPYKNFFVVAIKGKDSSDSSITAIKVFDYGEEVAHLSTYTPDSLSRPKAQLQIAYNYDVQSKNPRNVKRSSDNRKIEQMILGIKPAELSQCDTTDNIKHLVARTTKASQYEDDINYMCRWMYYSNYEDQIRILNSMINGSGDIPYRDNNMSVSEAFTKYKSQYDEAMKEGASYLRHAVTVFATPMGKYRVFNRTQDGDKVDMWIEDYESRDALPEEVSGQMAVLEISESSENLTFRRHSDPEPIKVDGVGMIHGYLYHCYTMIGENFRDTRSQSQSEGS